MREVVHDLCLGLPFAGALNDDEGTLCRTLMHLIPRLRTNFLERFGGGILEKVGDLFGLKRSELVTEKNLHLFLRHVAFQTQFSSTGTDPLTRRHTLHGVIIAQFAVARAQHITGCHLVGVVPVALSSGQLMDG